MSNFPFTGYYQDYMQPPDTEEQQDTQQLPDTKEAQAKREVFSFGQKGSFWSLYDKLADKFDKDMMGRLNDNLDNLLIFAGLFSAVNTAFIVVTLANLSPNPSSQTNLLLELLVTRVDNNTLTPIELNPPFVADPNAVRQNCVFFASLASSLLAATGAVLAKQWLQVYERTGQTGPLDKQGLRRTQKFLGAEHWRLGPVVESLPTLLLISLALFFVALSDYLWSVNKPVAITVTAFAAAGAGFYAFTVIAAALSTLCPFQTALSAGLRNLFPELAQRVKYIPSPIGLFLELSKRFKLIPLPSIDAVQRRRWRQRWQRLRSSDLACFILVTYRRAANHIQAFVRPLTRHIKSAPDLRTVSRSWTRRKQADESTPVRDDDITRAQSAVWILETSPEPENIRAVVQNIPSLSNITAVRLIGISTAFPLIVNNFISSLRSLSQHGTDETLDIAVDFARAVAHITPSDPVYLDSTSKRVLVELHGLGWDQVLQVSASSELAVLCLAVIRANGGSCSKLEAMALGSIPFGRLAQDGFNTISSLSYSAVVTFLQHCVLSVGECEVGLDWWDAVDISIAMAEVNIPQTIGNILSAKPFRSSNGVISLASLALIQELRFEAGVGRLPNETVNHVWSICHTEESDVSSSLLKVMKSYETYYAFLGTVDYPPNLELLRCQHLLLSQLRRLWLSNDRFLYSDDELPFLTTLRTAINLLNAQESDSGWNKEIITTVRKCNRVLIDCIGIQIKPSDKSWGVSNTPNLPEEHDTEEEKTWGPMLDAYTSVITGGETVTEQAIVTVAPLLTRALKLDSSPGLHITYRVLEKLLTGHYFPESSITRLQYFQPKAKISFDITAQLSSAVILMLHRQLEAGPLGRRIGWWGVLWLAGSMRDDAALARQLDHAAILHLVKLAEGDWAAASSIWKDEVRNRRGCVTVLFLEMWSACALIETQEDINPHDTEWASRDVLQLISSYTRSLADGKPEDSTIACLGDDLDRRTRRAITVNHGHTFHYIEHAVLNNPVDAMACGLDKACAWLIETAVGSEDPSAERAAPGFDEEMRDAAKRAGEALRKLSLRDSGQDPGSWEAIPCATCRLRSGENTNEPQVDLGQASGMEVEEGAPVVTGGDVSV